MNTAEVPKQGIPGDTEITLKLPASTILVLLDMLEKISAPRKQTDIPYLPIAEQYQDQFKKKQQETLRRKQ